MSRELQDRAIVDYEGPQGSIENDNIESIGMNRSKARNRANTMNRNGTAIGYMTGTREGSMTLTIMPELGENNNVNWQQALDTDEIFNLTIEKGIGGIRELFSSCTVASVNDTHNADGESRVEVNVEYLDSTDEPQ